MQATLLWRSEVSSQHTYCTSTLASSICTLRSMYSTVHTVRYTSPISSSSRLYVVFRGKTEEDKLFKEFV